MLTINAEMAEALVRVEQGASLKDEGIGMDFFHAWEASKETGNRRINFYELCHDEEYIVKDMRRAGIVEFTISERSTALLSIAARLDELGCDLVGITWVEKEPRGSRKKDEDLAPALLFTFK